MPVMNDYEATAASGLLCRDNNMKHRERTGMKNRGDGLAIQWLHLNNPVRISILTP